MSGDLEFTEEDMFSHLDRGGEENQAGTANTPEKDEGESAKTSEKLKRQRSTIPEAQLSNTPSPDNSALRNIGSPLHPVSTHFGHQDHTNSSLTESASKNIASRQQQSSSPSEEEKQMKRLGTSLPITIPGMEKAMLRNKSASKDEPNRSTTFVPPHMLENTNVDARPQSLNSGSVAKRDRLLQRNKILRRTGFLEGGGLESRDASGGLPELMDPLNRRLLPIKESYLEPSALSAALGTPRKD